MFAGNFAPRGWALCNGQILSIAQNTALFSILGTTYGGNGQTTFGLPDLRGRSPIGTGQGPGLSTIDLGELSGAENATLLVTQMPSHTHTVTPNSLKLRAKNAPGTSQSPAGAVPAIEAAGVTATYSTAEADVDMKTGALGAIVGPDLVPAGGSQPFSIRNPYLAINYAIALTGIFPSRN